MNRSFEYVYSSVNCADPRENPQRIHYAEYMHCATSRGGVSLPTRPERCALTFKFIYLFILPRTHSNARQTVSRVRSWFRFEARSQERRSQFCATSMSRMSSIAGAFRLAYTANDRYPDARIMDVSVTRRTLRMQWIIVMRDGRRRCVCTHFTLTEISSFT